MSAGSSSSPCSDCNLFEVDKGVAAGFATLLFLVMTVPLLVGGAVATTLTGLRIRICNTTPAGASLPVPDCP